MSNIKYLKDESGNRISPVTNIKGIFDDTGKSLLDIFYPVGSYYETSNEQFNPNVTWGGTWVQDTQGYCTVGANTDEDLLSKYNLVDLQIGDTTGEATHKLTISEMPSHTHVSHVITKTGTAIQNTWGELQRGGEGGSIEDKANIYSYNDNTGGSQSHNNVQPSIGVIRWHRTA